MAYDLTRCPQTEDEFRAYFYTLIGRTLGAPADGWESVLSANYEWQGDLLRIPPGVGPGITQPADAPFFGLTQQWSNGPKGRVFLPSATPDDLGYYTRCMQYLDDAVGTYSHAKEPAKATFKTGKSTGLVWAWYWVAGHAYTPVQGADASPAPPPSGGGLTEAQVQAMIDDSIEQALAGVVKVGDRLALRMAGGQVLCAEGGGPAAANEPVVLTSRSAVGPWESFLVEEGQG